MPVNRKLFTQAFTRTRVSNWRCPRCDGGHQRLVPGTFHAENTGDTAANLKEEWFDWDMVELRFVAQLRCDNDECREPSSLAGTGRLVEDPDFEEHRMEYTEMFETTYLCPSPRLINIPSRCPEQVIAELERAGVSQWADPAAAATHIRGAVERVLDDFKVPVQAESKRKRLTLHDRIELLRAERPQQAEPLLATKWIGNAGAHGEEVTRSDVFDMFDILETALDQLYGRGEELNAMIKTVNTRKGPVRQQVDL